VPLGRSGTSFVSARKEPVTAKKGHEAEGNMFTLSTREIIALATCGFRNYTNPPEAASIPLLAVAFRDRV
jgi:hypothetical protein